MIRLRAEGVREIQRNLGRIEDKAPQAVMRALNRAGAGVKTEAIRKDQETYTVKSSDIRPTIRLSNASIGDLKVRISSREGNLPLIRFKSTPNKPPKKQPRVLKATVKKGEPKKVKSAFVTTVGGHVGVLTRVGRNRLPIKELYGPAVPVQLNEPGVVTHLEREAERRMMDRLDHEIGRLL